MGSTEPPRKDDTMTTTTTQTTTETTRATVRGERGHGPDTDTDWIRAEDVRAGDVIAHRNVAGGLSERVAASGGHSGRYIPLTNGGAYSCRTGELVEIISAEVVVSAVTWQERLAESAIEAFGPGAQKMLESVDADDYRGLQPAEAIAQIASAQADGSEVAS